MDVEALRELLESVKTGHVDVNDALSRLRTLPYEDILIGLDLRIQPGIETRDFHIPLARRSVTVAVRRPRPITEPGKL